MKYIIIIIAAITATKTIAVSTEDIGAFLIKYSKEINNDQSIIDQNTGELSIKAIRDNKDHIVTKLMLSAKALDMKKIGNQNNINNIQSLIKGLYIRAERYLGKEYYGNIYAARLGTLYVQIIFLIDDQPNSKKDTLLNIAKIRGLTEGTTTKDVYIAIDDIRKAEDIHGNFDQDRMKRMGEIIPITILEKQPYKPNNIPNGAFYFNGSWYRPFSEKMTWHQANKKCRELGGHIATIESDAEAKILSSLFNLKHSVYTRHEGNPIQEVQDQNGRRKYVMDGLMLGFIPITKWYSNWGDSYGKPMLWNARENFDCSGDARIAEKWRRLYLNKNAKICNFTIKDESLIEHPLAVFCYGWIICEWSKPVTGIPQDINPRYTSWRHTDLNPRQSISSIRSNDPKNPVTGTVTGTGTNKKGFTFSQSREELLDRKAVRIKK